jgi:hypothetical protein
MQWTRPDDYIAQSELLELTFILPYQKCQDLLSLNYNYTLEFVFVLIGLLLPGGCDFLAFSFPTEVLLLSCWATTTIVLLP